MFDLGIPELLVILAVVVLLFGPARITEVMRALGRGIREFRAASSGEAKRNDS